MELDIRKIDNWRYYIIKLELIENIQPDAWNETISNYDSKFLFHQSAWLNFLEETQNGKTVKFKIVDNGKIEGYFVGLLIKKGPINILGSPLPGWTTDYMGPIVNKGFNIEQFLNALDNVCQQFRIHHVELCNPFLEPDIMHKMGFSISEGTTYVVPLFSNEDQMWKKLKSECRNRIRKGMKNGLVIEDCNDPSFVDEYYAQLKEVFVKQQLVPTYPIERIRSLFRNLTPNLLFALQVKYDDKIVATGIFPHDDRLVYFFGGASWSKFHEACPNELLHWTVMTLSAKLGISQYDMCGSGSFKPKFGGNKVTIYKYSKSYSILAKLGREAYKSIFYAKQRLKGKYLKVANWKKYLNKEELK